jgi:hypothetical protein
MSIVAVHGPQTFGSKAITDVGPLMSVVNPTNGLKWDFNLDQTTTRSAQDFAWTFPTDGTPTPQNVANPTEVTYATAGTKTAQCVVTNTAKATVNNKALTNNVATLAFSAAHGFAPGQVVTVSGVGAPFNGTFTLISASGTTLTYACTAADVTSGAATGTVTSASTQYPAAGTYTIPVTAVAGTTQGTGPASGLQSAPPPNGDEEPSEVAVGYDPAAHTVAEVQEFVTEHPDEAQAIYDAEEAGKNRATLMTWLEENLPFDPGAYTIDEVKAYVEANPDLVDDVLSAEETGKARVTLITWLEEFQA